MSKKTGVRRVLCFLIDKTMFLYVLKYELALLTKRRRRSCRKSALTATRFLVVSGKCYTFAPPARDIIPQQISKG